MHDDAQKKKNKQFLKRGFFRAVTKTLQEKRIVHEAIKIECVER
jgi:hypothetical protein